MSYGDAEARIVDWYRSTAFVVDPAAAVAAPTVARQPVRASRLRVSLRAGTSNIGSVTVTGTADGSPGTVESLAFTGAGERVTTRAFTALSSVATAGLTNESTVPTLYVEAVGSGGEPQAQQYVIAAGRAVPILEGGGSWPASRAGSQQQSGATALVPWEEVWQPREGDEVVDPLTSERWTVLSAKYVPSRARPRHVACVLQRRGSS